MHTLLAILHVFIAIALMLIVLLQSGKGSDIGAAFGGGASQAIFGGRGAATFLHKLTTMFAVLFFLSSLALSIFAFRGRPSVILQEKPAAEAPAAPAKPPAPEQPAPPQPGK